MAADINNTKKQCAVVIPAYKLRFDYDEERCVHKYFQVLKGEDIYFILPEGLDKSWYESIFPEAKYKTYADKFFKGIAGYNRLMLDTAFYESFSDYEYMLIAQPDAILMKEENMISYFCSMGYDYFGAPWDPPRRIWEWAKVKRDIPSKGKIICCKKEGIVMGNGGFSLRKIDKTIALIKENSWRKIYWFIKRNEDIFFGVFGRDNNVDFKPASVEAGFIFAREYDIKENLENGNVPFGVHGWSKEFAGYDEMEEYLKATGIWK